MARVAFRPIRPFTSALPALVASAFAMLVVVPAMARSTDVVILKNGDRLTGEVKGVARGKLDYSTDDAGRLSVEWIKVAKLTSPFPYQVELWSGARYEGQLAIAPIGGTIVVQNAGRADTLQITHVVDIDPLEAGFFQRVTSYLDVGFTLAKAHRATTFSLSGAADYRGPAVGGQFKFDSYAQGQENTSTTMRNSARQSLSWYLPGRWSVVALGQAEQNDELGLDRRLTLGGALSRELKHTNASEVAAAFGIVGIEEKFSDESGGATGTSIEGLAVLGWDSFRFDSPKLDLSTNLSVFPGITELGRVRGQLEVRVKYELFNDFNVGLLFTDTFDSRPPSDNVQKNDYITTFTIGWSYRR